MEKWIGKTAIVTGASAGIGAAIVRDFARHGINVIALARRAEKLHALQQELKDASGKVIPMRCDVSEKSSIDATFEEIAKKFGSAQILVNNAGIAIPAPILSGDDDEVDGNIVNTVQTNFVGLVRTTRRAYTLMEQADDYGIIINIGSVVSHVVPFTPFNTNVYSGECLSRE
jgi:NAD(P)-dependent dehydrogenase (short-subunit alcohol dehydrogenase family)